MSTKLQQIIDYLVTDYKKVPGSLTKYINYIDGNTLKPLMLLLETETPKDIGQILAGIHNSSELKLLGRGVAKLSAEVMLNALSYYEIGKHEDWYGDIVTEAESNGIQY